MKPVDFEGSNVVMGKGQPEYIPLPAYRDDEGKVTSVWELTDEERQLIADGAKVCTCLSTFGHSIQPQSVWISQVADKEEKKEVETEQKDDTIE